MLKPGDILQNRYVIVRGLKGGGMGTVYEAKDNRFECSVAIKSCNSTDQLHRDAFKNESRLLVHLRHPALPVAHDCFEENGTKDSTMTLTLP
jgi:serine/threonine protein kinase